MLLIMRSYNLACNFSPLGDSRGLSYYCFLAITYQPLILVYFKWKNR